MLRVSDVEKQVYVEQVLGLLDERILVDVIWQYLAEYLDEETYYKLKKTELGKDLSAELRDWWDTDVIGELISD